MTIGCVLLQGTARPSGQDELQPEGNGTGFLWDDSGNLVTNYHVLQSALAAMGRRPGAQRSPQNKPVVAKITLLGDHWSHVCCTYQDMSMFSQQPRQFSWPDEVYMRMRA